jgi:type III pantothenate kinase
MWMALAIGNSRLHWGLFAGNELQQTWHSPYFVPNNQWITQANIPQCQIPADLPLVVASVVPTQTNLWQPYAQRIIHLSDIPLQGLYPSLGIDRALAAYGAVETYGYPVLVVDGGTALTITGINAQRQLVGGAIWPGLRLQLQSLHRNTAALGDFATDWVVGERWATDTAGAIASGILHSTAAGIREFWQDWQRQFSTSQLLVTGGDGEILSKLLESHQNICKHAPDLVFQGISLAYKYYEK